MQAARSSLSRAAPARAALSPARRSAGALPAAAAAAVAPRRAASLLSEDGQKHTPYGREGSGLYSLATRGCYDVMRNARRDVLAAAERALFAYKKRKDAGPFVIADYGTADGGTSMPLLADLLAMLRKEAGPQLPILVVYEDQVSSVALPAGAREGRGGGRWQQV